MAHIPKDAVTLEIAPHALLQSVLKRSLGTDCLNIGLQKLGSGDNLATFYQGIGKYVHHITDTLVLSLAIPTEAYCAYLRFIVQNIINMKVVCCVM